MKILVADDHALFREGMRHVLADLEERIEVFEAANSRAALDCARLDEDLDLVLLDLNMPDMDGFEALTLFCERYPALPVVILSASNSKREMRRALDMGALGFIPKDSTGAVVLSALRLVLSGGIYVPPSLVAAENAATAMGQGGLARLTNRQHQVLALLAEGKTNKEIANELELVEATVKMHVTAIMRALDVSNRTQAVVVAERLGLK
jgi:DNA-binding NarL/FixJ family response regulator